VGFWFKKLKVMIQMLLFLDTTNNGGEETETLSIPLKGNYKPRKLGLISVKEKTKRSLSHSLFSTDLISELGGG